MAELDVVFARQYGANVYRVAQQKTSKLRNFVTIKPMKGELMFLDRSHPTSTQRRTSKYGDSPMIPTQFSRRALHAQEYEWGDMIDWPDDTNLFIDPTSEVTAQGSSAFGRTLDDIIITDGFEGDAYEGKTGSTVVPFPSARIVPITTGSSDASNMGMTLEKLRVTRSMIAKSDVDLDDPENKTYLGISQDQLDDLLRTTEVTNADYAAVKALVAGTLNSFYGFEFVRTQRLHRTALETGYSRNCVAWCKSGVVLALPEDITMRVSERADKGYNWYAYGKLKGGCTRIEDAKVVHVPCYEAA